VAEVRDYLSFVEREASARHAAGIDAFEAARDIARHLGDFAGWGEFGRVSVNVETVYRTLDATHESPDVVEQFRRMSTIERS
jgi:hypothetical protein